MKQLKPAHHTLDKLVFAKAQSLTEIYMFCVQWDLVLTISKDELSVSLPWGGEMSVQFNPVVCETSSAILIYEQLQSVKRLLREVKESLKESVEDEVKEKEGVKENYLFDESVLRRAYLNDSV